MSETSDISTMSRGHNSRNYTAAEFREAFESADSMKGREKVRAAFRKLDGGRFYDMLDETHNVIAHLDLEGRRDFKENASPWLLGWVSTFGLVEDLNQFEDMVEDEE